MKRSDCFALIALAMLTGLSAPGAPAAPPHLIIILTDNQGDHDVGFHDCQDIPAPNLETSASNGVRLTSGYVSSPLSSPSQAGLLTGRYQERFGSERDPEWPPNNPDSGLPLTETTRAETLQRAGYAPGIIGKWPGGGKVLGFTVEKHGGTRIAGPDRTAHPAGTVVMIRTGAVNQS